MNSRTLSRLVVVSLLAVAGGRAADSLDDELQRVAADYARKLQTATDDLNRARERIAAEKLPVLKSMRAAEDRIIAAEQEITRIETSQSQTQETQRRLLREAETLRRNESYVSTLAHDGLKAFSEGLAPGEAPLVGTQVQQFQQTLDDSAKGGDSKMAVDVAEFLLQRAELALGGYAAPGRAMIGEDNRVVDGVYAFAGPETYFRSASGLAGTVRAREGAAVPVVYSIPGWNSDAAAAFFRGDAGTVMADASTGKALRLRETKGTIWEHIGKGGIVAYAILGVGLVALLMVLQKIRDLTRMAVDSPAAVERFLGLVSSGAREEAQQAVGALRTTTRDLFGAGLRQFSQPKAILEEHLYAVVLRQRLFYERWLPLLAVIATAAPLMGLLGTVTGLVKTFALITVFGTGNAGKLASGISEVLVATELGLMVAIPTLVAHGFLSHRIQKNLSLLERYALEFVTAAESAKQRRPANPIAA
jgi:biopolymer transport protein ExbB